MKTELFLAETRGHADHGWLDTHHTFSFADYCNPARVQFGALRVVNDDIVAPDKGFGTHPHDNMEIVSIPLRGALRHRDSMGNGSVIRSGEVQVMSAGTGITHSEFNANSEEDVNFFQIWIFPNKRDVTPRYEQKKIECPQNHLVQIVSPDAGKAGVWMHQAAWFHMGHFDAQRGFDYALKRQGDGLFAMVVEGRFDVAGHTLGRRDAVGITDADTVSFKSLSSGGQILLIEVPMAGDFPK
ncbi:MAG: pirin family protein [Puniceicoccales bacterium]|jgi:redox-sensitive bicupin YhaK (pirin superfamily)|nr:pirin family protein [Puniceicoccales bacterium]